MLILPIFFLILPIFFKILPIFKKILPTMYKIYRDRRAIKVKIIAGKIVQIVSTSCVSIVLVCVSFAVRISEII